MAPIKVVERDDTLLELEARIKLAVLALLEHAECAGFSLELPATDMASIWIVVGSGADVRDQADRIIEGEEAELEPFQPLQ